MKISHKKRKISLICLAIFSIFGVPNLHALGWYGSSYSEKEAKTFASQSQYNAVCSITWRLKIKYLPFSKNIPAGTGILLDNNTVLTAAHVAPKDPIASLGKEQTFLWIFKVQFVSYQVSIDGKHYTAKATYPFTDGTERGPEDIALLTLDENIKNSSSKNFIKLGPLPIEAANKVKEVAMVGAGVSYNRNLNQFFWDNDYNNEDHISYIGNYSFFLLKTLTWRFGHMEKHGGMLKIINYDSNPDAAGKITTDQNSPNHQFVMHHDSGSSIISKFNDQNYILGILSGGSNDEVDFAKINSSKRDIINNFAKSD